MDDFWNSRCIFKCYSGSLAYGTNITEELSKETGLKVSDTDIRGVCIPPADYMLGLKRFEQYQQQEPDTTIYALQKFIHLAEDNNPSILELLFMPDDVVIHADPLWSMLSSHRHDFLSKRCHKRYGGYAKSQRHRIENNMSYHAPVRHELKDKYGYDTKFAMHLIRLLRTGVEVLRDGELNVRRPDAEELFAIRTGKYTFEEVMKMAADLEQELDEAVEHSNLPDHPDFNRLHDLCVGMHLVALDGGYFNDGNR